MPLGSASLGLGPLGLDPVAPASAAPGLTAPAAAVYDPMTRDLVIDDAGLFTGEHPVDQAVALSLTIALGTIASAEGVGQGYSEIVYRDADIEARVTNAIRLALKARIDAKDVSLDSVTVEATDQGFNFLVAYRNLRLPDLPVRRVTLSG